MTISFRGVFSFATCTIIRPMGPTPAITTTSSSWMSPRFTAWIAQASGSMIAASSSGISAGIRCTQRGRRNSHVLRHSAVGDLALEAEDVVHFAHPVFAGAAIAAALAGDDLLGDHPVAHRDAEMLGGALAQRLDVAEEFVARDDRRLDPRIGAAPEHLGARPALAIAGADAAGGDADHHLPRTGTGRRIFSTR